MPTNAGSYANAAKGGKGMIKGPKGTASQRATKSGAIKGRKSTAGSAVAGQGKGSTKQGTRKGSKRGY